MPLRRNHVLLTAIALFVLAGAPARAVPRPHRLTAGAGVSAFGRVSSFDDGHSDSGPVAVSPTVLVGYSYRFLSWLSVGVDVSWCRLGAVDASDVTARGNGRLGDVFRLPLVVRGHLSFFDDRLDVALGAALGLAFLRNSEAVSIAGWTAGGTLEVRYGFATHFGAFVRTDALIGGHSYDGGPDGYDTSQVVFTSTVLAGLSVAL